MKSIGIITNDHRPVFQSEIIKGVKEICEGQYEVLVDSLAIDPRNPKPISLDIESLEGILVIANALSQDELHQLFQKGKPLSLVSHYLPELPIPAVNQNNSEGILKLVDYVVGDCERRKPVFIQGDMRQHDAREREEYFERGLMHHNIVIPEHYKLAGDFNPAKAALEIDGFMDTDANFDAVIASDFLMACAVLDLLIFRGVRVPEDVTVVGFGDGDEAAAMGLTVVGVDVIELGRRAARQLISQIQGQAMAGITWLNTELVKRKTGC